jgi:large subunit ribosomal protein L32e
MEMADEKKRLIRVRSERSARFKRDGMGKKKQIADSWRKPRGLHSKKRIQKKAKGPLPSPGFGSPVAVKGMHPSGYREVLVFTPAEMGGLDPEIYAVRIGASVGNRKRLALQEQAMAAGLKVLNPRDIRAKEPEADEE